MVWRAHARPRLPQVLAVSRHRRRSLLLSLAGLALLVLGLARLGGGDRPNPAPPLVQRLFMIRPVTPGARLTAADLGTERLPAGRASPHQLAEPDQAIGRRVAVGLPAGSPLMDAELLARPKVGSAREVAVRLDDTAGIPAGDLADTRADLYLTPPGRRAHARLVLADVVVLAAERADSGAVATLLLPRSAVAPAIAAESEGSLRLVVHAVGAGAP